MTDIKATKLLDAAKQALESLERMKSYGNIFLFRSYEMNPYDQVCEAITSLRQAISELEQRSITEAEQEPDYKAIGKQAYESGYSTGYMDGATKTREAYLQEIEELETENRMLRARNERLTMAMKHLERIIQENVR